MAKRSRHRKKNCLIIEWLDLPQSLRDHVGDWDRFGNDRLLTVWLDCKPCLLTEESIRNHYVSQIERKDKYAYKGTFEKFIEDRGLQIPMWVATQGFDLSDVDMILINVSW